MLGTDDKTVVTQHGSMPQLTHFLVGRILLSHRHMLQEVGFNHNTVEVRRFGCVSSHWQPCKRQLVSAWRKLQTKDLQWISLYSRVAVKIVATQMAGMYNVLTLSKCPVIKVKCPTRATQGG